jgi:hypothetical protein
MGALKWEKVTRKIGEAGRRNPKSRIWRGLSGSGGKGFVSATSVSSSGTQRGERRTAVHPKSKNGSEKLWPM